MDAALPALPSSVFLLLMVSWLPATSRIANAADLPLLCDFSRENKLHLFECSKKMLQSHVLALLEKRGKRFFKGRRMVDAITEMCINGSVILNNNVALAVMQVKEEDKSLTEYVLWSCMNSTRYLIAQSGP